MMGTYQLLIPYILRVFIKNHRLRIDYPKLLEEAERKIRRRFDIDDDTLRSEIKEAINFGELTGIFCVSENSVHRMGSQIEGELDGLVQSKVERPSQHRQQTEGEFFKEPKRQMTADNIKKIAHIVKLPRGGLPHSSKVGRQITRVGAGRVSKPMPVQRAAMRQRQPSNSRKIRRVGGRQMGGRLRRGPLRKMNLRRIARSVNRGRRQSAAKRKSRSKSARRPSARSKSAKSQNRSKSPAPGPGRRTAMKRRK